MPLKTRSLLIVGTLLVVSAVAVGLTGTTRGEDQDLPPVSVYKDPNCGCCSLWVTHLEQNGFRVTATDTTEMPALRAKHGIPQNLQSCHTAIVDGYVVEGHVPAEDVKRLLATRPAVKGIAVPGMPIGSPGMEQGTTRQPYSVLTFDDAGQTTVFARH